MAMTEPDASVGEPALPEEEKTRPSVWKFIRRKWLRILASLVGIWIVIEAITLPFGDIVRLKEENPSETAFMREHAAEAKRAGKKFRIIQQWVPLSEVPKDVINAVIVAEDGLFWTHGGFDWFEFRESVERNLTEGRAARGASTITQQLVKNLYLSPSKNPLRKIREWILTWWMEQNLSKHRILEIYLNVIEWGRGIYGINAASRTYFGKPVRDLTREEGIRLAAVIPNPGRYEANETSKYMTRMTAIILNRMAARGMVKDSVYGWAGDSINAVADDSMQGLWNDSTYRMLEDSLHEMLKDSVNELQRY